MRTWVFFRPRSQIHWQPSFSPPCEKRDSKINFNFQKHKSQIWKNGGKIIIFLFISFSRSFHHDDHRKGTFRPCRSRGRTNDDGTRREKTLWSWHIVLHQWQSKQTSSPLLTHCPIVPPLTPWTTSVLMSALGTHVTVIAKKRLDVDDSDKVHGRRK